MLLQEFERRVGDPNQGGSNKRPLVTAYRQDALRCARFIQQQEKAKVSDIRKNTQVEKSASILQRDVYGWFQKLERGIYELSPKGKEALETFSDIIETLEMPTMANDAPPTV